MSPVKSCGFAQRATKDVNEMTLVLLNDINNLCTPHLFFVHVCAIMELQRSSKIGELHSQTKQMTKSRVFSIGSEKEDEERCIHAGTQFL